MKRIIRKRVVLVLLLSLCLSLTACGNGNSGDSGNDSDLAAETFTKVLIQRRCSI